MSVELPDLFNVAADVDVIGPVELSGTVGVSGIPSSYSIDLTHIAKIQVGLDPLTINPLTINPLTINPLTVNPLDVSVRIKEFPSIRGHVPADFTVGLSILGFQLMCLRLCGEAQVITEPYHPNPCERCDEPATVQPVTPVGTPGTVTPVTPK
ncbi:MAG: hypothetical protein WAV20_05725 [Blastocatellia bacterium]